MELASILKINSKISKEINIVTRSVYIEYNPSALQVFVKCISISINDKPRAIAIEAVLFILNQICYRYKVFGFVPIVLSETEWSL